MVLLAINTSACAGLETTELKLPRFGRVHIYPPPAPRKHVALLISGNKGWNQQMVALARQLSAAETLVVGIELNNYLRTLQTERRRCAYPAADFEALSQVTQQRLGLHEYEYPVLVGYAEGAALAYTVAAQAPKGTFHGAVSLGFSPQLSLNRSLCQGSDLHYVMQTQKSSITLLPASVLMPPWRVLQGQSDEIYSTAQLRNFIEQVPGAQMVILSQQKHLLSVDANTLAALQAAFLELANHDEAQMPADDSPLHDLPLVEVPVATGAATGDTLAVMVTGDGGWAGLDQEMATQFAEAGIPVVGLNSLKYFWTARDAATTAHDVARIARHYLHEWNKQHLLLVGYSFGADVLPFVVDGLPTDVKRHVALWAMLGPDLRATFEFHVYDWMGGGNEGEPILPVLRRLHGIPPALCIYGSDEAESLCRGLDPALATSIELKGAHHFDGDYAGLTRHILAGLKR